MMRGPLVVAALGGVLCVLGCSYNYSPRATSRISLVQETFGESIATKGRVYDVGPFGGGLVDATEGNPRAQEHARTAREYTIAGFVIGLTGAVSTGVGAGVLVANEERDGGSSTDARNTGIGMVVAGLAAGIASAVFYGAARARFYDAVNVYNDDVEGAWPDAERDQPLAPSVRPAPPPPPDYSPL